MASGCSTQTPAGSDGFDERQVPLTTTTTTSFQDGVLPSSVYAGTRDTVLSEDQSSSNFGTNTTCRIDSDDPWSTAKDLEVLLSWSVASIPVGSVVTAASVTLQVTDSSSGVWSVYGLERPWSEVGATWLVAEAGTPWGTAGAQGTADRGTSLLGTFTFATGSQTFSLNAAGLAKVQAWLDDPASNYGLILVGPSSDGLTFQSREAATASVRPRLDLTWQTGTDPAPIPGGALVPKGATWKYLDTGVAPSTSWRTNGFSDGVWKQGTAELGYGDGDESTVVGFGADAANKFVTTWFRHSFSVADPTAISSLMLACKRDDGVIVYLNGTEILRSNMPAGVTTASTLAKSAIDDQNYYQVPVATSLLLAGANVLSAEVHQAAPSSSDISFDLSLEASGAPIAAGGVLIPANSSWSYRDNGVFPGSGWQTASYVDSAWPTGLAELGYGDGDETQVVGFGANASNKFITTWFRKHFNVSDASAWTVLNAHVRRDDGAVVYLNGTEVMRSNLPSGPIGDNTLASHATENQAYYNQPIDPKLLITGDNVLAVEVHQAGATSSDISFDLLLDGLTQATTAGCVPASCDDGNPCTADACNSGTCVNLNYTVACDDGNPCTASDTCSAGACQSGANICECQVDSDCASKSGGNLCVGTYTCDKSGAAPACKLVAGSAVTCSSAGDSTCSTNQCIPATGLCAMVAATDGATCSDGSLCTTADACQGGVCTGPGVCDDNDLCTDDVCDLTGNCTHALNSAPCSDGNACTTGDKCYDGNCFGSDDTVCVDDGNPCTSNLCDVDNGCGAFPITNLACDDGNLCTTADTCTDGTCGGTAKVCNDSKICTDDSCAAGVCVFSANTASCSDGNPCTTGDVCSGSVCLAGTTPLSCDDSDVCTDDFCNAAGCAHSFNTAPCSDNSSCTSGDACQGGVCKPAATVACDDLNPCTDDACDAVNGCTHSDNTLACDDGTVCTSADACVAGQCTGTTLNCADTNACTADSCDPVAGCQHVNTTATCTDNNACTTVDTCVAGACVGSAPLNCNDNNPCTVDTCTVTTGKCKSTATAATDGLSCTPAGGCTSAVCTTGLCISSSCAGETWPWDVPSEFLPATKWFDPTGYHVAEITLSSSDWSKYLADVKSGVTETWYKANVKIDGTTYADVGIRAFGYGSMLSNPGKPNIRVNFNKFTVGVTGPENLRNVRFKASGQDASMVREPIIYGISRAMGGDAPRTSYAKVKVNGENYGIFQVMEHVDKDTFKFFWGTEKGTLFEQDKGCVGINCTTSGCTEVLNAYKIDGTNTAPFVALAKAINNGSTADWIDQVSAVADWDSFKVFYAMDVLTSNVDGMTAAANNYDAYGDTKTGKLFFIHHGMDLTLGNWSAWYSWTTPWGPPCTWCKRAQDDFYARMMSTSSLKQQMWDVYKSAHCGPFATSTVNPLVDKMKALLKADQYADPKTNKSNADIDSSYSVLKTFITNRNKSLDALSGVGTCP